MGEFRISLFINFLCCFMLLWMYCCLLDSCWILFGVGRNFCCFNGVVLLVFLWFIVLMILLIIWRIFVFIWNRFLEILFMFFVLCNFFVLLFLLFLWVYLGSVLCCFWWFVCLGCFILWIFVLGVEIIVLSICF